MVKKDFASSGNHGDKIRSDCWIGLTKKKSGGIKINLESKVGALYGESIKREILTIFKYFNIKNGEISVKDKGALPFVLRARIESAVIKLGLDNGKKYLSTPEYTPMKSNRARQRRSRLYLPGNQPKIFLNAAIHKPDGIILDLEDSVAFDSKLDARILVRNALISIDFFGCERMVRINQLPLGLEDLEEILETEPNLILVPKVETTKHIIDVDQKINEYKKKKNDKDSNEPYLMPIIESAQGVINSYRIATASKRIVALAIGLEDYTADIGTQRTKEGRESIFARQMLVNAAKAAGIQAIDTVFSDVSDMEGLKSSVLEAKALGFDGKGCIHPRQIAVINQAFLPEEKEIDRAKQIVRAFEKVQKQGLSVVSIGSKMIDPPVVKRALRVIKLSEDNGLVKKNWRKEDE